MTEFFQGYIFAEIYEIIGELDSGGFAKVYHARDMDSNNRSEVALKIFELSTKDRQKKTGMHGIIFTRSLLFIQT